MKLANKKYAPSWVDKIVLFGKRILGARTITDNCTIFICEKGGVKVFYLKFSYPGNVQFHRIDSADISKHIDVLESVRREIT